MQQLVAQIVTELRARGQQLACAESCTAGLLAAAITEVAGASEVFYGGFVTYTNQAKMSMIGVDKHMLETAGAVSRPCAQAMVAGVFANSPADYALSVTGLAGPGGSGELPVGLVYIGCGGRNGKCYVREYHFLGTRAQVREQAVIAALGLLLTLMKRGTVDENC